MAQFDLYRNLREETAERYPYLLDVQAEILDRLASRVVVPLRPLTSSPGPMEHLEPVIEVEEERFSLSTAELSAVSRQRLGAKVANLSNQRTRILAALDFLLTGV